MLPLPSRGSRAGPMFSAALTPARDQIVHPFPTCDSWGSEKPAAGTPCGRGCGSAAGGRVAALKAAQRCFLCQS